MRRIIISILLFIASVLNAQNVWTDDDIDWISSDADTFWYLVNRAVSEYNATSNTTYYKRFTPADAPKEAVALQRKYPGHYFLLVDDFDTDCAYIMIYDAGYFYRYYVKKLWITENEK